MARPPAPPPLPITGERTVPGVEHENYWFQRHVVAYRLAACRTRGADVLDAGCGEGYGTAMLAQTASSAVGVELVEAVVDHARAAYPPAAHPALSFLAADICNTGLATGSADVVVNLQVIEHLPDVGRFLGEQRRLLRDGGELIVATPNRLTFTPHSHEPTNIFHVEEFTAAELVARLRDVGGFTIRRVLGLHHGHRLRAAERVTGQPFTELVLQPVESWPRWLTTLVADVAPQDFVWSDTDLDESLDLLVVCSR